MASPQLAIEVSNSVLGARWVEARQLTDSLFRHLRSEALYDRPIPERHRLIFYLGHLEAFDWNLIGGHAVGLHPFHAEFDKLFAFGIDPVDGGLPSDQPADWPREREVRSYCDRVRTSLNPLIHKTDRTLLHVAIEHRLMHAETLAYLLHQLPLDRKTPRQTLRAIEQTSVRPRTVAMPRGIATLGQSRHREQFGWDNEFEEHRVVVRKFTADAFPITNAQFLQFVNAGGYDDRSLWSMEDWAWKNKSGLVHPHFWSRHGNAWRLRTMFADIPLPQAWPAYVSHAEASAYARWTGKKLPTEAQWHRMAYGTPQGEERAYPWGEEAPNSEHGNFNFVSWDPMPVQAYPQGSSAFGVADLLGNGWEWTSTEFQPFSFYPGYSANFFDGKHFVMKGGSPCTATCMLRRSFRNWFQPHYPYLYAKFRCVEE
jgi:gamma-glutamyl hercynylcysteine S-oxide synthase